MRSFHWFHLYFVPKVRKYLDSKGLPSKILFILDNALSHTEPCEFNTDVFYLPPNTTSLIQLLDQGVMRTFKAHYSQYSVGGTVNTMEQNLDRENNLKVWKDYTIENVIVVLQKSLSRSAARDNKFLLEKTMSRRCAWLHRIATESIKEIMKSLWMWPKKKVERKWRVSRYGSWRNSRANRHHIRRMNRRQFHRNKFFPTSVRQGGRRCRRISTRKHTDII